MACIVDKELLEQFIVRLFKYLIVFQVEVIYSESQAPSILSATMLRITGNKVPDTAVRRGRPQLRLMQDAANSTVLLTSRPTNYPPYVKSKLGPKTFFDSDPSEGLSVGIRGNCLLPTAVAYVCCLRQVC